MSVFLDAVRSTSLVSITDIEGRVFQKGALVGLQKDDPQLYCVFQAAALRIASMRLRQLETKQSGILASHD